MRIRISPIRSLAPLLLMLCACNGDGDGETTAAASTTAASTTTSDASTGAPATDSGSTAATSVDPDTTAGSTSAGGCAMEQPTIVTDIDETLTLSDGEFLMQIGDGNYDPVEREGAAELINAYADLGYHVLYLTARSETIEILVTNETAREATERWLDEHGFPNDPATTEVVLADMFVIDAAAQEYKAQAIMDRQAMGQRFDYAYGNATSDIGAYADAGIPLESTFIIGEHGGVGGTVAVAGEGWVEHTARHIPTVPAVCQDG